MSVDDDGRIDDDYRPGSTGIVMILVLLVALLALLFVFRDELGIPIPEVAIDVPDEIPETARSPAQDEATRADPDALIGAR